MFFTNLIYYFEYLNFDDTFCYQILVEVCKFLIIFIYTILPVFVWMDSCRMYKQKKIMGNFNIENEDFFKTEIAKVYIYILFCFLPKKFLLLRIWHFVKSILLKRFWNVLHIPKWGNEKKLHLQFSFIYHSIQEYLEVLKKSSVFFGL